MEGKKESVQFDREQIRISFTSTPVLIIPFKDETVQVF